jgi:non-specific serine/threonine protein kinase
MMRSGLRDTDSTMRKGSTVLRHSTLPRSLTPLIGREREVAAVASLLRHDDVRLLTLFGTGGVGKTRLALHVAGEIGSEFADGAVFVSLAAVRDPGLVLARIADRLGLETTGDQSLHAHLIHHLQGKELCLVLDNYEQVVAAAPHLANLLLDCPRLKLLVTSRTVLRLSGERIYTVPPLGLPETPVSVSSGPALADVARAEATRLFVERAQAAHLDFVLDEENAPAVAEICARLDGLPLAIELAAARVATLPPPVLIARLDRRLPLLTTGTRDAPPRQQTMHAAIAWSHDLLTSEEQALFRRLSVFVGGFTLEAAEYVSRELDGVAPVSRLPSPDSAVSVLDGITALVERSLLRTATETEGGARYGMLETLREFGVEQLAASGEEVVVRGAHAAWFLALAERGATESAWSDRLAWRRRLHADRDNCRAALAWAIEREDAATALRLAAGLGPVWIERGPYREVRSWLERALALGASPTSPARIAAQLALARLLFFQGDFQRAAAAGEEALTLARATGDRLGTARALIAIGEAVDRQGDLDRSVLCHEEALALFRAAADVRGIAETLSHLGVAAWLRGDIGRFAALAEQTLPLYREVGDHAGIIASLDRLSLVARIGGQLERQAALAGEMISLCRDLDDPFILSSALWTAAAIAEERGEATLSARFFGAAEALREASGLVLDPAFALEHARSVERVQTQLGPDAFASTWTAGRGIGIRQALDDTEDMLDRLAAGPAVSSPVLPAGAAPHNLTQRELDVLRLVVEGLTDREIAGALFIARRTASKHVESILDKLGVTSRGAAASAAVRLGLV